MDYPEIINDYLQVRDIIIEVVKMFNTMRDNNKSFDDMLNSYNYYDIEIIYKLSSFNRINKYDFAHFEWNKDNETYNKIIILYNNYKIPLDMDKHHIATEILNYDLSYNKKYMTITSDYENLYKFFKEDIKNN